MFACGREFGLFEQSIKILKCARYFHGSDCDILYMSEQIGLKTNIYSIQINHERGRERHDRFQYKCWVHSDKLYSKKCIDLRILYSWAFGVNRNKLFWKQNKLWISKYMHTEYVAISVLMALK